MKWCDPFSTGVLCVDLAGSRPTRRPGERGGRGTEHIFVRIRKARANENDVGPPPHDGETARMESRCREMAPEGEGEGDEFSSGASGILSFFFHVRVS